MIRNQGWLSLSGLLLAMTLAVLAIGEASAAGPPPVDTLDTTVMSFNIRYGAAADRDNSWPLRRELVFKTLAGREPAIFGVQECLWFQGQELKEAFPGFTMTGVGRDDGNQEGEMCAIFTRTDRYQVLDKGTFWLSETPEVVGSKGWDAALPRIATWVRLHDRLCVPDTLIVFNAHFDHVGKQARKKSAELLRARMATLAGNHPLILMGDFNDPATMASASYEHLLADCGQYDDLVMHDTWFKATREEKMKGVDTFHGFTGEPSRGRIDWILMTDNFEVMAAGIDRSEEDGRYPSDHFPVWATFRTKLKEGSHGTGN